MNCFDQLSKLRLHLIVIITLCLFYNPLFSQISLEVSIDAGTVSSTCEDPIIGGNNPTYQVNVANQGWETYPSFLGLCYNNTPNLQFSETYACPADVPFSLEICFRVYDEDGLPCNQTTEDCLEEVCETFQNPFFGSALSDSIVISGATMQSTGTLEFTITTGDTDIALNDKPCQAIDLGVLPSLGALGDATISSYNNICSDGVNEPNPVTETGWNNNQGVWFKFTTSNDPSSIINVLALDDPSNVGDGINLQLALYETSNDLCNGTFSLVDSKFVGSNPDEVFNSHCLDANKTYFILVDGATDFVGGVEGWFGLQVIDEDVVDGADLICNAENIGAVPTGGMISTGLTQTNACATAIGDEDANSFDVQNGVWYQFTAPPSGNVIVEGISDLELPDGLDPVDIQIALFESANNTCSGNLNEINSSWTVGSFDESITANCLTPETPYWILIDGSGYDFFGVFEIRVTDTGFNPLTQIDTTICAGSSLILGNIIIGEAGPFTDTIFDSATSCVIPVSGTLSFYDSVNVAINQISLATDVGIADGAANGGASGGAGNYSYLWSDGQTSQIATSLIGGNTYCVTVTDDAGCAGEQCFIVEYVLPISISTSSFAITCFGENDGSISILVTNGEAPFDFVFEAAVNTIYNTTGTIQMLGDVANFTNLLADTYTITVSNDLFSEVIVMTLLEPEPFIADANVVSQISCFGECDASVEITFVGGTNPPPPIIIDQVCAGTYSDTFMDGNGCEVDLIYQVLAPTELIAATTIVQEVTCFGLSNGSATVLLIPDTDIQSVLWDNGETTNPAVGLEAGLHSVTVMDVNGCEWMGIVPIEGPNAALEIGDIILDNTVCIGDQNGTIEVNATGGYNAYVYNWDNGQVGPAINGLSGGTYIVTVTDSGGCEISETITFVEPAPIIAELLVEDGLCTENGDINGGVITFGNVTGGVPPYQYSLGTANYGDGNSFGNLASGPFTVSLIDANGCIHFYEEEIIAPDSVFISLEANQSLFNGDSTTIFLNSNNNNLIFVWTPDDELSCNNCQNPVVTPTAQNLFMVTATDTTTNCQTSAQIVISVSNVPNIFVPNVFSPNGDGNNEALSLYLGAGVEQVLEFEIFDRWGNTMFGAQNFSNDLIPGWDGTFKGTDCPPAVYPFVVKYMTTTGIQEYKSGTITLLR